MGALISRRRGRERAPLAPLTFGGGQERGLRPGTLPVALIAGLGEAAAHWTSDRWVAGLEFRQRLLDGLAPLRPLVNGDMDRMLPFILNVSIPGFESDTIMQAWEDIVAVSSGAACSSASYTCSHVLPADRSASAIRFSWCHMTEMPDMAAMVEALHKA